MSFFFFFFAAFLLHETRKTGPDGAVIKTFLPFFSFCFVTPASSFLLLVLLLFSVARFSEYDVVDVLARVEREKERKEEEKARVKRARLSFRRAAANSFREKYPPPPPFTKKNKDEL